MPLTKVPLTVSRSMMYGASTRARLEARSTSLSVDACVVVMGGGQGVPSRSSCRCGTCVSRGPRPPQGCGPPANSGKRSACPPPPPEHNDGVLAAARRVVGGDVGDAPLLAKEEEGELVQGQRVAHLLGIGGQHRCLLGGAPAQYSSSAGLGRGRHQAAHR